VDSESLFDFLHHSHLLIFMKLGKMTDADKAMNPQHFGSDLADIWIRIRINPEIRIRIIIVIIQMSMKHIQLSN